MSNIFNFKRFANYLVYDLNNAKNNYGMSMLVIGLLPFITFACSQLMAWIVTPENLGQGFGIAIRVMTILMAIIVVELTAPSKLYGRLTERRYGSDWLQIPASALEKFLSMLIMVCIVLPLAMCVLLLFSDTILALVFPARYGENIFAVLNGINLFNLTIKKIPDATLHFNMIYICFLSWVNNILIFTLGSVVFKKAKVAKTILAVCAVGLVVGNVFGLFFNFTNSAMDFMMENNPFRAVNILNNFVNITSVVEILLVGGGLYYRLRTIQH